MTDHHDVEKPIGRGKTRKSFFLRDREARLKTERRSKEPYLGERSTMMS